MRSPDYTYREKPMTENEWMKEAELLIDAIPDAARKDGILRQTRLLPEARAALLAHISARPLPQATLSEEDVLRAIQSCGRDLQGKISLTYDSGPYEVTKPTQVAMRFARAVLAAARQVPVGDKNLSDDDVFTLMGHAVYLRGLGQEDMPRWCYELAERIAMQLGDEAMAERVREVAEKEVPLLPDSPVGQEEPGCASGGSDGVPGLGDMRAEFKAWVEDRGCDTDGAWSAWQGCWNLLHPRSVKVGCANCGKELAGANGHDCKPLGVGGADDR